MTDTPPVVAWGVPTPHARRTPGGRPWQRPTVVTVGPVGVAAAFRGTADEAAQPSLTLAPLVDLLERGEFDLVAVGRAVLADPAWAGKVVGGCLPDVRSYDKSADAILFEAFGGCGVPTPRTPHARGRPWQQPTRATIVTWHVRPRRPQIADTFPET